MMGNPIFLISIHAPREGGDVWAPLSEDDTAISIHAPREGGDEQIGRDMENNSNFNPRPPRGGRLYPALFRSPL